MSRTDRQVWVDSRATAYVSLGWPTQNTFFCANTLTTTYDAITGQIGMVTYASGFAVKRVCNTLGGTSRSRSDITPPAFNV
jgi:hypothetical protein